MTSHPDKNFSAVPVFTRLQTTRLVAVVTIERPDDVPPLCRALLAGGVSVIECALRTPQALEALTRIKQAFPEVLLGAGTVLTPAQADKAREAGADFALAPGFDPETVRHCAQVALPFIPGVATASEIQAAIAQGCRWLKWFPAGPLGGVSALRTLAAPFRHLGVKYLPLGGISIDVLKDYLAEPDVGAVGGSWIAPTELVQQRSWEEIERRASTAVARVRTEGESR
ncbi:MAG TPA: bifunctional 4-hydroxy-2-oxoglutarate aldolase/2-dehydro-3-deoxy-phosphogluconate aldolase [Opitutaceae bacterium]|nr:bifunctional 4-hydroxy-2-oxoglutarate aldolase/2-dehydro-3-deoxy-phosphogluconate aldolase [Opitutaceae bacterium]